VDKASQWEVGANYFDVCHDSDPVAGDVKEALTKITQGKMLSFNTQYSCHSLEEERWFELNIRPLVSRSDLFLIQHRNITDQVIAKLESTKLQHQITEIANSGPGMVYQFKGAPDGTYSFPFVSEGARQIFDLEPAVLIKNASKAFELVLEEDLNELLESIERVISNPRRWQHSFRIKTARGIRHLQGCSSPSMIGEDGTVTFNGVILDVTEKTTAQTELDRNRRLLALAGKMAGVGGWHIDLAKNKLFWTEQTYRIYGLNPELPAPTVEEAIQFYAPEARSIIKNAVEEGIRERSSFDLELPFFNKEGRRQWVRAIGEPVFEGENVAGLTGTFQDITTQKKNRAVTARHQAKTRTREILGRHRCLGLQPCHAGT